MDRLGAETKEIVESFAFFTLCKIEKNDPTKVGIEGTQHAFITLLTVRLLS